jgi:hypothetical protein
MSLRTYQQCLGIKTTAKVARGPGNHFQDEVNFLFLHSSQLTDKQIPEEYLNKRHINLRGETVFGVEACTSAAYDQFRKDLMDDWEIGWKKLMEYDWASTRSYLTQEAKYPPSVVQWMETRTNGTASFDKAFSEVRMFFSIRQVIHLSFTLVSRRFLNPLNSMILRRNLSNGTALREVLRF